MSEKYYPAFGKIPRHRRSITITEKIDGSNGLILIEHHPEILDEYHIRAGGRNRWLAPGKQTDNHGFAQWVETNKATLAEDLGPGHHYGEWWGNGINRGYGLAKGDKRFSLFNVTRWFETQFLTPSLGHVPAMSGNIPWEKAETSIEEALAHLREVGSWAAHGFMDPEGIIIFKHSNNTLSKITLERDDEFKGKKTSKV